MKRMYEDLLREHIATERQMAFIAGPRQVGKTTLLKSLLRPGDSMFNWDRPDDRADLLKGSDHLADRCKLLDLQAPGEKRIVAFDEIHKFRRWKNLLKGFFDACESHASILVTGSARLNVYKRGGDSLMGRYFLYRMHPLSVAELAGQPWHTDLIAPPRAIDAEAFDALVRFGGFPEPLTRANSRFYNRWIGLRMEQMFREELRDLTRVQEIDQLLTLSRILTAQAGGAAHYSRLASDVRVSVDTIRRWLTILESLYFAFRVRPWYRNVSKSLRKQPKIYPWDWSPISDEGQRAECFVASHFLKAIHWWTDMGLGTFELFYIRDTSQREVDFLIVKDAKPWIMVEVKKSTREPISASLKHFAAQLAVPHAFQAVMDMEPVDADCFAGRSGILRVPVRTLLSQLV